MNYIDYIIIILIVLSAIGGAFKGFIHEVSSLIGLVAGVWSAIKFSGFLETYLVSRWGVTTGYVHVISFVIVLFAIIILVAILSKLLENAVKSAKLSTVNRLLGFMFSVFKAIFFIGVLVILIESLHTALPFLPLNSVKESKLSNTVKIVTIKTFPFVKSLFSDDNEKQSSFIYNNNNYYWHIGGFIETTKHKNC